MKRMTREEVIEYGKFWLQVNEDSKNSSTYAFFQRALKALEKESIIDKIRAEIDKIYEREGNSSDCLNALDDLKEFIDKYKVESKVKEHENMDNDLLDNRN